MKNLLGSLTLVAGLALVATGCSAPTQPQAQPVIEQTSEVEEYVGVCINPETQNRVDDDYCEDGDDDYDAAFVPYFFPYGYMIPGVGSHVSGGHSSHKGPYVMGFNKTGGSSTGFKSTKKQYFTKGFTLPSNAKVKQAQTPAQPAVPATPAQPAKQAQPAVPAAPAQPAQPVVPVAPVAPAPKVETKTDTRPKNNYRSSTRSTTPRTRR